MTGRTSEFESTMSGATAEEDFIDYNEEDADQQVDYQGSSKPTEEKDTKKYFSIIFRK